MKDLKLADPPEYIEKHTALLKEAAAFMNDVIIPNVALDCAVTQNPIWDGKNLSSTLHERGVNVRYLGRIVDALNKFKEEDFLPFRNVCVLEMICRAVKPLFAMFIRKLTPPALTAGIAHFLNAFVGIGASGLAKPKKEKAIPNAFGTPVPVFDLTSSALWDSIVAEVKLHFQYDLEAADAALVRGALNAVRNVALKTGIKIRTRDYAFSTAAPFTASDILDLQPVVKHVVPVPSDGYRLLSAGREQMNRNLQIASAILQQCASQLSQVVGPLHRLVGQTYSNLTTCAFALGDDAAALDFQARAILINERVLGFDHPDVVHGYQSLGVLCHRLGFVGAAVQHVQRAAYLAHIVAGHDSPYVANYYHQLAQIAASTNEELSISLFRACIALNEKYFGVDGARVGAYARALARKHASNKQWKEAQEQQTRCVQIFGKKYGAEHKRTQEVLQELDLIQRRIDVALKQKTEKPKPAPKQSSKVTSSSVLNTGSIEEVLAYINGPKLGPAAKGKGKQKKSKRPQIIEID
eukprot:TRINITY_DN1472_c0_g1_i1.p1 TRINITY_DN1472_c0_g1~~TRINITY_DN1472_c0_g1_i1.p1  ORF type:complete len:591 (+),score=164.41 TRINITY_DN1472_c0_g1_i1:204-1775(+)